MAAISQIRHKRSDGRAFYEKKAAEGKTHKEALRALKRRTSSASGSSPQPERCAGTPAVRRAPPPARTPRYALSQLPPWSPAPALQNGGDARAAGQVAGHAG